MANPNDYFDAGFGGDTAHAALLREATIDDPNVGEKLRVAAELRDARDAVTGAEKALARATARMFIARRAARAAGVDIGQAWGAEPVKVSP